MFFPPRKISLEWDYGIKSSYYIKFQPPDSSEEKIEAQKGEGTYLQLFSLGVAYIQVSQLPATEISHYLG